MKSNSDIIVNATGAVLLRGVTLNKFLTQLSEVHTVCTLPEPIIQVTRHKPLTSSSRKVIT